MKERYIVKKKSVPLAVIEMMITSLLLSAWLCKKYNWDWVIGVLLFWALLAYSIISGLTRSKVSPWLATGAMFVICLVLHKGYFYSQRNATRIEYEER